jgi:hypothetical protein
MSRNRPRPRDNGFGNNEELELWTKICQDIRKSKEKFDQQTLLSLRIKDLIEKITNDGNSEHPRTSSLGALPDNTKLQHAPKFGEVASILLCRTC